jgi:hypothetical protein
MGRPSALNGVHRDDNHGAAVPKVHIDPSGCEEVIHAMIPFYVMLAAIAMARFIGVLIWMFLLWWSAV